MDPKRVVLSLKPKCNIVMFTNDVQSVHTHARTHARTRVCACVVCMKNSATKGLTSIFNQHEFDMPMQIE